uniref:Uncharacterized protein n=1 Tax=Aureoumbra lagunensis TaxID=44058 RepID=A0A7S3JW76_9STRA
MLLKRILSKVIGWFVRKNADDTTERNLWLLQPKQICQRRLTIIFEKLPFAIRGMVWEFALGFGRDVKNIIKTMSVSQNVKDDICRFCLKEIDTSTIDFHKSLGILRTLVKLNDSFESLTFRSNWKEFLLILYWLQSRNITSKLKKLRVLYEQYNGLLQTWSVVHDHHRRDNTIDLTDEAVVLKTPTDTTSTDFLQFMENNQELVRSKKLQVYFDFPALYHLKFPFPLTREICSSIISLTFLHTLELNIWKSQENRAQNNFPDATQLIDQLKFLRILRLTQSTYSSGLILIKSNSVEIIDLCQAGKGISIRLDTPKLQELHISDNIYGNGIRRLDPASNFSEIIMSEINYMTEIEVEEEEEEDEEENEKENAFFSFLFEKENESTSIPAAQNIWFPYNSSDGNVYEGWKSTFPVSIPDNCLVIFHRK